METKPVTYTSRLVNGFNDLDSDEGFKKPKGRNRQLNYGHSDADIDGDIPEQIYFELNKKSGKWKKRAVRG